MHYTDLFGKTKRDAPAEITDPARRLAYRAGLIRPINTVSAYLPLAVRVLARLENLLAIDMERLGAQPLRGLGLDAASLAEEISSYKHLPAYLFGQSGTTAFKVVALESDLDTARATAEKFEAIAARLFETAQLPVEVAPDANAYRRWFFSDDAGDMEIMRCSAGDYVGTRRATRAHKLAAPAEELLPLEPVETPHCETIEALAQMLGVPASCTAKAVFYTSDDRFIFAVVRGDLQIDESKLMGVLGISSLRPASEEEIRRVGAVPGYASPIGVRGATVVVDDSITSSPNLVAGANREGYHLLNTNVPRDYRPDLVADIALAQVGQPCPHGDGTLELIHGNELGFVHGPVELDATYLDANGRAQKIVGVTLVLYLKQVLLAYLAAHHDDKGVIWNRALAPFPVHIVGLNADKLEVAAALARVTGDLDRAGVEYLLDDRTESAGVKFNDADLIGLPVRVTVGPRTVAQQAVEVKRRAEASGQLVPFDDVLKHLAI